MTTIRDVAQEAGVHPGMVSHVFSGKAKTSAGIVNRPEWIDYGYFVEDGGHRAAQRMAALGTKAPTAYNAANDLMAVGIMRGLRQQELMVPQDVSVVGTNDSSIAKSVTPRLTSLHVPYAALAAEAASMLIRLIEQESFVNRHVILESHLVQHNSTGPLRARVHNGAGGAVSINW